MASISKVEPAVHSAYGSDGWGRITLRYGASAFRSRSLAGTDGQTSNPIVVLPDTEQHFPERRASARETGAALMNCGRALIMETRVLRTMRILKDHYPGNQTVAEPVRQTSPFEL